MSASVALNPSDRRFRWLVPFLAAGACMIVSIPSDSRADEPVSASALLEDLRCFREMGSVLHIAAHPDDENTQLITYLARGRHCRAAYLSLTRGDGGQNVIGPEFFEELGVIRTQELLAARRLDGGRQFFTRAIDFGYSKSPRETLSIWDRQQVLADIVRIIRTFRPDVLVTRFSPQGGGHGHHTASAVLAVEAFKLAGDSQAFPEQLKELTPWQPKRILQNGGGSGRGGGGGGGARPGSVRMEIGGNDPVSGERSAQSPGGADRCTSLRALATSVAAVAAAGRGPSRSSSWAASLRPRTFSTESIRPGDACPAAPRSGGRPMRSSRSSTPKTPPPASPRCWRCGAVWRALPSDPVVDEKRLLLDRIVQGCLGLEVATEVPQAEVVPGEDLVLRHVVKVRSSIPVRWLGVRYPGSRRETGEPIELHANEASSRMSTQKLPAGTPLSQPYWLREDHTTGLFRVDDPALIGRPENPPAFPVEQVFEVGRPDPGDSGPARPDRGRPSWRARSPAGSRSSHRSRSGSCPTSGSSPRVPRVRWKSSSAPPRRCGRHAAPGCAPRLAGQARVAAVPAGGRSAIEHGSSSP